MMSSIKIWIKELRVNQWTKNAVVFAAWFFALADASQAVHARGMFAFGLVCAMAVSFSFVSSAFYLLNDVSDYEADRLHPVKKLRPVAADVISKISAVRAALVMFALGLVFPCFLVLKFPGRTWGFAIILIYILIQCAYSGCLKQLPYVDVVVIAAGFVLRAVAGAAAIDARISPWLLGCAFLLSIFLALSKRRHEHFTAIESRKALKGYNRKALDMLIVTSAVATIAVYACYTIAADTVARFHTRGLIFTSVFVAAGIVRYLHLVYKKGDVGRPEKILLTDRLLWLILTGYGLSAVVAVLMVRL